MSDNTQLLEQLRAVVEEPYRLKHGKALTLESGWAWEALAFIGNELGKRNRSGIEGQLVEAGTLSGDSFNAEEPLFTGLLIRVPMETLRDAKTVPLYRKVRVVEVSGE